MINGHVTIRLMPSPAHLRFKVEWLGAPEPHRSMTVTEDMYHAARVFIHEVRSGRGALVTVSASFNGPSYDSAGHNEEYGPIALRWLPPEQRNTGIPGWLNSTMHLVDRVMDRGGETDIAQVLLPTYYYDQGIWRPVQRLRR